ncbi:hypothetical protein RUM44_011161 [Polyplax serrata]|uniref:Receptor L-domain domain-containing protein n=1 Tax=Polyplax serrata TaxID=468196 RepID=A0ABR1APX4_POLSC
MERGQEGESAATGPHSSGVVGFYILKIKSNNFGLMCGTIDIRNNISNFEVLRGCQVIEGNLQIVLMTNRACEVCNELINNITFPELREVTGYVVFWRVQGLRSFGTLFPNLSVIRGKTLFHNYALVIYESKALEEVGLYSLTHILRGSVRFDENANLCFVDTIDWDLIAPQGAKKHFIGGKRVDMKLVGGDDEAVDKGYHEILFYEVS